MRKVFAVIGAGYGDCGKGLITDWLSYGKNLSLTVRYNSGAQAGHTVVSPEGQRHVFHHLGSGSLRNAPTFLSEFFAVSPIFFVREHAELLSKNIKPVVFMDARCQVTTPWDIMLNQAVERSRGNAKHGSCGMGFNETIERGLVLPLTAKDMPLKNKLKHKLHMIRHEWVPHRLEVLGIDQCELKHAYDNAILHKFMDEIAATTANVNICDWEIFIQKWHGNIVFEGAQGLKLDQSYKDFPHVTRSNTGLRNVMELMQIAELPDLVRTFYVTRTYTTRHGAGPFPEECDTQYEDKTNIFNEHQGHLRYGFLNIDSLIKDIKNDSAEFPVKLRLALTCADQTKGVVTFTEDNERKTLPVNEFAAIVCDRIKADHYAISVGPTRLSMSIAH